MNTHIPLTAGQQYYVEFYVFNAQGNNPNNIFPSTAYSRRIGAFFTPSQAGLSANQINGLNNTSVTNPQIPNTFPAQTPYNATGWQKISGYFTPNQTTNWTMVIGNFDPGMNSLITDPCPPYTAQVANPEVFLKSQGCGQYVASYYYVDAVTVIPAGQTPPSYAPTISGNISVCSNSSTTYTLNNIPFGATPTWSVTPTNLFSGATSSSGALATLLAASGLNGKATLTYTLTGPSGCGNNQVSKTIAIGTEVNSFSIINTHVSCVNNGAYLNINYTPMFISSTDEKYYAKDLSNPNNQYVLKEDLGNPTGGNGTDFPLGPANRSYSIEIVETFACGTLTGTRTVNAPACTGGGGGGASIVASPNPASTARHNKIIIAKF